MKSQEIMVSVPIPTLNALKSLLFSQGEGSINLGGIIEDLGGRDLTAVNVGLAYKGIKPEIDTACRYDSTYGTRFVRYEFKSYSLILDRVFATAVHMKWNANGLVEELSTYETAITLQEWYSKLTEPQPPEEEAK
jgi:hypothetical protein